MAHIELQKAHKDDKDILFGFVAKLEVNTSLNPNRAKKIEEAIKNESCFLITADNEALGMLIFDYRFFDLGWIELLIISDAFRGKGIANTVFDLLCSQCRTDKLFTSTNASNQPMLRALQKAGFSFAGELTGLDDGDPELFFYKRIRSTSP